jgi:uncharacterized membrane protein
MKLQTVRESYYFYTSKASDLARQLAIAAIAAAWLFKAEQATGSFRLPALAWIAGALAGATLLLDILQYVVGGAVWGRIMHQHEKAYLDKASETDVPTNNQIPKWIRRLYRAKVSTIIACYLSLTILAASRISF